MDGERVGGREEESEGGRREGEGREGEGREGGRGREKGIRKEEGGGGGGGDLRQKGKKEQENGMKGKQRWEMQKRHNVHVFQYVQKR